MKKNGSILLAALALITALSGCEVVGGIFKAGMWTGVIVIVLVVVLIIWIIRKFSK